MDAAPSGTSAARPLVTNAPPGWPSVVAPERPGRNENVVSFVSRLSRSVASALGAAGLEVVDRDRRVLMGQQVVKVDVVVRADGAEVPVFVFPGVDADRESAMFSFLRAALRETGTFGEDAVYYAVHGLRHTGPPSESLPVRHADAFLVRAQGADVPLEFGSSSDAVVDAVRALAPTPVESGGGDTVMEAACFVGEWLRNRSIARWIMREDLPRSVLVVEDIARSTQWHLPLFAWFPDAVRTGYDGLRELLDGILADSPGAEEEDDGELPIASRAYRREASRWLESAMAELAPTDEATTLLRRCAACGEMSRTGVMFEDPAGSLDAAVSRALAVANAPRSPCAACGSADFREMVLLYALPIDDTRAVVVTEVTDSHVRIATRELQRIPA